VSLKNLIVLIGLAVAILYLFPSLSKSLKQNGRPALKAGLRTGLELREQARAVLAEVGEQWADLIAEVEAEQSAEKQAAAAGQEKPS
jgi:hypothetical protein